MDTPAAIVETLRDLAVKTGGQPRHGQDMMGAAVGWAFDGAEWVQVEAPCGTGKTRPVLVGAILDADRNGRRTVISTAKRDLQSQYVRRDAPQVLNYLAQHGDRPHRFGDVVALKGKAAYGCFSADTEIVTRAGRRRIGDLVGQKVEVLDGAGNWTWAPIEHFGVQQLWKLVVRRTGKGLKKPDHDVPGDRVIYTTGNHRWFTHNLVNTPTVEVTTADLQSGDKLASRMPLPTSTAHPSPFGIAHGIVFGDGSWQRGRRTSWSTLALHHDSKEFARFFQGCRLSERHHPRYAQSHITISGLPVAWKKTMPPHDESTSYILGFICGLVGADGHVSDLGSITLTNADRDVLQRVRDLATAIGIVTTPVRQVTRGQTVIDGRDYTFTTYYQLTFARRTWRPEWCIKASHRERFEANPVSTKGHRSWMRYEVVSCEPTDRWEDVYCARVPTTESFVLDDFILTGNCKLMADREIEDGGVQGKLFESFGGAESREAQEVQRAAKWVLESESGDWSEVPFPVTSTTRNTLSVDSESCLGRKCRFYDECHSVNAWHAAKMAPVVVVNHALLCVHVANGGGILPPFETLVIDEAHELESFALNAFGAQLTFRSGNRSEHGTLPDLASIVARANHRGDACADRLTELSGQMRELVDYHVEANGKRDVTLSPDMRSKVFGAQLVELSDLAGRARELLADAQPDSPSAEVMVRRGVAKADTISKVVADVHSGAPSIVTYLSRKGRSVMLRAANVDIAPHLAASAWHDDLGQKRPVVICSATMPPRSTDRIGLAGAAEVVAPSPFDLASNCIIYAADQCGSAAFKNRGSWEPKALAVACELAGAALETGSVLVLAPSFTQMRTFAGELGRVVRGRPGTRLLVEDGDRQREELLDLYRKADRAILCGSRGMYTGLDMPGKVRLVIITSIPYRVPGDPVWEALCKLHPSSEIPHPYDRADAAASIAQAAGRLNRCATDWGVVAILDERIVKGRWATELRSKLPQQAHVVRSEYHEKVCQFLRTERMTAAAA